MAGFGAFVTGNTDLIKYFRYNMRSQIYAKTLCAAMVEGADKRLSMLETGKELREAMSAAMKLTPEQQEARKKLQTIQRELQKEIVAILTPEQQKALRTSAGKRRADSERPKRQRGERKKREKSDK